MGTVGSNIKAALAFAGYGCDCDGISKRWDNWGTAVCEKRKPELVSHLVKQASNRGFKNVDAILETIVDEAIRLSKEDDCYKCMEFEAAVEQDIASFAVPSVRSHGWNHTKTAREAMRRYFAEVLAFPHHYPGGHAGRGIVILGGGHYFASAYVQARAIRALGCTLPIELWHFGASEFDDEMQSLMNNLGVESVDATELGKTRRRWGGWEAKFPIVMACRFQEVLFLDADNFPAINLAEMFDSREYHETGAILWPNDETKVGFDVHEAAFSLFGLPVPDGPPLRPHHPTGYRPLETGQFLVDKSRCWKALAVAAETGNQSDFFYPAPKTNWADWYTYGETGCTWLAFNACSTEYHCPRKPQWSGDAHGGQLTHYLGDRPVLQHRTQPGHKIRITSRNRSDGIIQMELFDSGIAELKAKWSGKLWSYASQSENDNLHSEELLKKKVTVAGLPFSELRDRGRTNHGRYWWSIRGDILHVVDGLVGFADLQLQPDGSYTDGKALIHEPLELENDGTWCSRAIAYEMRHNHYRLPERMDGWNVVDIGANIGLFTNECVKRGATSVIAVEADATNFSYLARNSTRWQGVSLMCAAAWRETGFVELLRDPIMNGGHMVAEAGDCVPAIAIDDILRLRESVDLLKIDAEGAEWVLLFTSRELCRVSRIVCEYHLTQLRWWQSLMPDVVLSMDALVSGLQALGYRVETQESTVDPQFGLIFASRA